MLEDPNTWKTHPSKIYMQNKQKEKHVATDGTWTYVSPVYYVYIFH